MSGWFRCPSEAWPEAVAPHIGARPWSEEMVRADLAWWADRRSFHRKPIPGYRHMMRRWSWSEYQTRRAMREALGDVTAPSPQDHRAITAPPPQAERVEADDHEEITAPSPQDHRAITAPTSTRAYGDQTQTADTDPDEEGAAGPAPLPAVGRVTAAEGDGSPSATDPPPATQPDPVEIVAAEWWRLWSIRRERHPRGAPRSSTLTKEDREAIRKVVGGRKPKITTDEAIMVCRWAFYGQDFHARHLRGEASEDQAENEHLSPVACYRPAKLAEKLAKARIFMEDRQRRKASAPPPPATVEPLPAPIAPPPPAPPQPPELDPETAERLARIRASAQHRRRLRTWPHGEPHAATSPTDG